MRMLQILVILLVSGVVFVNGWTDAPNAIAGIVATKAMTYRKAVWFAALCNLAGLVLMSAINSSVAVTITQMADFGAADALLSLTALLSAMLSIIIFAVAAWRFGIPTSESHALIAAVTGAALALGGSADPGAWGKILLGLVISLTLGFLFGLSLSKTLGEILKRLSPRLLDKLQIFAGGVAAFMHGAQDGQKFVAVFVIAELLSKNEYGSGAVRLNDHKLVLFLCALTMALGTSAGGRRIIETVGEKMVSLKKHQSVCADLASGLCLFIASVFGVPVSTTHTKTTAIMGACAFSGKEEKHPANLKIIGGMLFAWAVTFPVCGLLGFLITRLALVFMK